MECYHYFAGNTTILITNNVIVGNDITIIADQYATSRRSLLRDHLGSKIKKLIEPVINATAITIITPREVIADFLSRYFCFDMNNSLYRSTCCLCEIYVNWSIRCITIKKSCIIGRYF
jgi:hypothetical protein